MHVGIRLLFHIVLYVYFCLHANHVKNKISLHLNQSYINVWNRNHTPSRFRIPLITIPNHSDWDSTIDIKNDSDSNSHLESESAPGLNHSPVIIMLVCKINMFLKSDKHNSSVYLLKVTFMSKNLFDTQGTKNCSLIEMYSWLYLSTFWKYSQCTWVHLPKKECTCT